MIVAIGVSYAWIDRPLCEWIFNHGLREQLLPLASLFEWPPLMSGFAPLILIVASMLPPSRQRHLLILFGVSVLMTFVLKNDLKWVFSRYWPMTWTHQNFSWISHRAYGFQWFQGHLFQGNDQTGSFPSGHAAVAFAALLPVGMVYRKFLVIVLTVAAVEALAMVAFDYHFLSDVLAGALVGISCVLMTDRLLVGTGSKQEL